MFRFNSVVLLKHIIHDLLCLHPVSSQVLRGSQGIYGDHHFHHIAKGGVQHASLSHASRLEATGSEVTQKNTGPSGYRIIFDGHSKLLSRKLVDMD